MTDEANPKHYLETSIFRNGKESEQEVAFENVNNLTLIQKFYYGQNNGVSCRVTNSAWFKMDQKKKKNKE
ncbi:hypothetical protein V1478_005056 [Vespula squamosa]|uniref:Uncharacterized protein n=1 Tax=Vespula squamosa TaxID=30214 RepID=A0ABD2BAL6_VESSQ